MTLGSRPGASREPSADNARLHHLPVRRGLPNLGHARGFRVRQKPSDEIDTIAYAVSFLEAAKVLAPQTMGDNHTLIVPFYALIGFSLENGLKALLEHGKVEPRTKWFHSHDLSALRNLVEEELGIELREGSAQFIDHLSTPHLEHHFRYPQKADRVELNKPPAAVDLTERILISIFLQIDGPARIED
jgi:hypothetical protein